MLILRIPGPYDTYEATGHAVDGATFVRIGSTRLGAVLEVLMCIAFHENRAKRLFVRWPKAP